MQVAQTLDFRYNFPVPLRLLKSNSVFLFAMKSFVKKGKSIGLGKLV